MTDGGRTRLTEVPGEVANQFRGQPMLLAVMLMNFLIVGGLFWFGYEVGQGRAEVIKELLDRCMPNGRPTNDLLLDPPKVSPPPLSVKKEE